MKVSFFIFIKNTNVHTTTYTNTNWVFHNLISCAWQPYVFGYGPRAAHAFLGQTVRALASLLQPTSLIFSACACFFFLFCFSFLFQLALNLMFFSILRYEKKSSSDADEGTSMKTYFILIIPAFFDLCGEASLKH